MLCQRGADATIEDHQGQLREPPEACPQVPGFREILRNIFAPEIIGFQAFRPAFRKAGSGTKNPLSGGIKNEEM
jgi:hypothetical protein